MSFFQFCVENLRQKTHVGGVIALGLIAATIIVAAVTGLVLSGN